MQLIRRVNFLKYLLKMKYKPAYTAKYICNSHTLSLSQKLQKSLSVCQRFFAITKK